MELLRAYLISFNYALADVGFFNLPLHQRIYTFSQCNIGEEKDGQALLKFLKQMTRCRLDAEILLSS